MNSSVSTNLRARLGGRRRRHAKAQIGLFCVWLAVIEGANAAANPSPPAPALPPPTTPREFFNAGTQKLHEGKLREAEAYLESALSSQAERLQPRALYNLGEIRFTQGIEELKKGPQSGPTLARSRAVSSAADQANHVAADALAGSDLQNMVNAYLNGRGVRRELKAATIAVRKALQAHNVTLSKWQRASGDFHGAFELKQSDADADFNASIVDRSIARLVDTLRELQQMADALGDKNKDLGEKLKQLKGRIPAPNMPPGAAGDDEEDEDQPFGPKPGDKEGPAKEGQEMSLSPEQAGWLLEGYRLDNERRLPMGQNGKAEPRDRNRPDW